MKSLSTSQRVLTLLPIILVMISTIYFYHLTASTFPHTKHELPKIQGVILKEAQRLTNIHLTDHQGKTVNSDYFLGKWHFIAYGYTHCPDICPTTLLTLTHLADFLSKSNDNLDTQFVFYSVDPDRDSQKILAQYIHYFSENFVALRANTSRDAENFQQRLGIKAEVAQGYVNNKQFYQVSHGLTILLINPDAQLQAVFSPEITKLSLKGFSSEILYRDYLKVIEYYYHHR